MCCVRFLPSKNSVTGGLRIELVIIIGGLIASAHASMMIVIPVMPRFMELIGGGAYVFGLTFTLYALGRFITNIPAGALSEIIGRKWVVTVGAMGVAVFAFLSGIPEDVPLFLLFRFLSGVFSSMTIVVGNIIAADLSTVENMGRVLGLMQGMQLMVGTGSPALGGFIGELVGTRFPFYISGIAVLIFAIWAMLRLPETKSNVQSNPSNLNFQQMISLALAESRGAWKRMIFFIFCIGIGVGAVMTVKSFSNMVQVTIQGQAKGLLAADIGIKGSWEQGKDEIAYQKETLPQGTEFLFIKEMH